jgi:hypothetical protein
MTKRKEKVIEIPVMKENMQRGTDSSDYRIESDDSEIDLKPSTRRKKKTYEKQDFKATSPVMPKRNQTNPSTKKYLQK